LLLYSYGSGHSVRRDPNRQTRIELLPSVEEAVVVRNHVAFKPGVDRLESREVLSTSTLGVVAPAFMIVGQPPRTFPTGPGLFVPLSTRAAVPPTQSLPFSQDDYVNALQRFFGNRTPPPSLLPNAPFLAGKR
jgi:hypothetical protein